VDDVAEETLPLVAGSPKTSPLSSLHALLGGAGDDGGAYTDPAAQDTGFTFSLWVRLAGALHTSSTALQYVLGSGLATNPHNAYLAYRAWPNMPGGSTHQLVMQYAQQCVQPVLPFAMGAGIGDGLWHMVRVTSYLVSDLARSPRVCNAVTRNDHRCMSVDRAQPKPHF
jgi:hypothetical protein